VALPGLPERGNHGELPQTRGRLRGVQGVEEVEAIRPHGLGIGVAWRLLPGQPRIFDPSAVPFIPGQRCQSLEPVRCHSREGVEGGSQGLGDEFQAVEHPDGGQHMGRVGAWRPTGLEEPQRATPLQELVQQQRFGTACQQSVPKFTQDRKVEARLRQFETQQILPVDARADGLRGLAIGEVLPKRHDRHQRQPPRGQAWWAPRREQGRKVVILKDGPQDITHCQIGMAFGKGRMGNAGGFIRHRLDDVRVE